jgi:type IV pilus assembly protein PilC
MPTYAYIALDAHGGEHRGTLEASDARQAAQSVREQRLFPTDIVPASSGVAAGGRAVGWRFRLGRGVRAREVATFARQLATLLRAGMPLLRSLQTLARQERNPAWRRILGELAQAILAGGTFADALARHPRVFDRLFISMVRAGEAGGALAEVLDRLARFQEKSLRLKGRLASALAYPAIVLIIAAGILAGLVGFVVPKFRQIFADLLKGAPLPPLTQAVLGAAEAVRHHAGLLAAGGIALAAAAVWAVRTPAGQAARDRVVLRLPALGDLVLKGLLARFGRTLGTLLASGVPILTALAIARETCGNGVVAAAIDGARERVREGASLSAPLADAGVFPPMVAGMVDVGENTGRLPEMLGKIAEIYDDEVDAAVAGLSSLVEPLLIVFLAGIVGVIVVALFLPIVRIVQLLT